MRIFALAILFLLSACTSSSNDPTAIISGTNGTIQVTVHCMRENMVHDPISIFFRSTSPASETFTLPKLVGRVDGSEIPVKKGYYRYAGSIRFVEGRMIVDLYYVDTDDNKLEPVSWNGSYQLQSIAAK